MKTGNRPQEPRPNQPHPRPRHDGPCRCQGQCPGCPRRRQAPEALPDDTA
ncbi:MAG: hypothetical protein V1806_17870 [Pseudomonadota bacterium]